MKKIFVLLLVLVAAVVLYGQEAQEDFGSTLNTGRAASLGVEATTILGWDIEKGSVGLETKVGLELIFDLFPAADRGIVPENTDSPAVRLLIKDAAFTWWNSYSTRGGNYEQDDFNHWKARPLTLTFDTFSADVVWKNYFFRIASSTTMMKVNTVSLFSIFDDLMDANDRFYYRDIPPDDEPFSLWSEERYNIQQFPLLRKRLQRDAVDADYTISGILAAGAEFEKFNFTVKAASFNIGYENTNNAWLFGADAEIVPIENLKIDASALVGINYDKEVGENPLAFGAAVRYQLPLSEKFILTPYLGFDFLYDTSGGDVQWELGAGVALYTRGLDERVSYRVLDFDDVIPIGASFGVNIDHNSNINLVLSWFDPAGRDSLIENFGGFLQLEIANLLSQGDSMDFALLAQFEYIINGKFTPYFRGGYRPEFSSTSSTPDITRTGNMIVSAALGCYITPVHFFSFDLRYEMKHLLTTSGFEVDKGLLSAIFTIRM
ncbi:MAG: hypothetical protein FWD13_07150 [Treponema sp.]|nr:hypothetical protein [Treponema sp.]